MARRPVAFELKTPGQQRGDEAANEEFCNSPALPRFGPWDVEGNAQVHG